MDDDDSKEKRTDDISAWDQQFLKVEQSVMFDLILVRVCSVLSMNIHPLMYTTTTHGCIQYFMHDCG